MQKLKLLIAAIAVLFILIMVFGDGGAAFALGGNFPKNRTSENIISGYPRLSCPEGYSYDTSGSNCVKTSPTQLVRAGGRGTLFYH